MARKGRASPYAYVLGACLLTGAPLHAQQGAASSLAPAPDTRIAPQTPAQDSLVPAITQPLPPALWLAGGTLIALLLLTSLMAVGLKAQVRRQTRNLQESESRLNTILDSVDACIYIKDTKLRYTYANRQLCERFDRRLEDLIGASDSAFLPASILNSVRSSDLRVIQLGQRVVCEEETPRHDGAGTDTYLSIKIPLRATDGSIEALCGIATNITELRNSRAAIHRLAYYDALTDLPNRRMLQERMEEAMLVQKDTGVCSGILFIDLDKFKNINDERGHDVGDAVLCSVAHRLVGAVRREDTVARLGGDEFVILLHDLGSSVSEATPRALQIAETVRRTLADAVMVGDQSYFTGGSVGVTLLDPDTKSVADVLREADMAMYQSKERGRNRVALFEPSMHAHVTERASLLRDLVMALNTEQFQLLVQPQYDPLRQVIGAELLLRWDHPTRGTIMPEKFVSLAEESGIVLEVGEWALKQACQLHARLTAAGCAHPISVNVSSLQLRQAEFNERVKAILSATGTPPDQLVLELTESVLIDDVDETARRMQILAKLGVRFSIDDFGTGYSSLAYLHRLPLYELKIAQNFVRELPGKDAGTLIRLIIATAHLLELRVVAEGVERAEQAEFLVGLGCNALQGYFYQHPVPMETWIEQRKNSAGRSPSSVIL